MNSNDSSNNQTRIPEDDETTLVGSRTSQETLRTLVPYSIYSRSETDTSSQHSRRSLRTTVDSAFLLMQSLIREILGPNDPIRSQEQPFVQGTDPQSSLRTPSSLVRQISEPARAEEAPTPLSPELSSLVHSGRHNIWTEVLNHLRDLHDRSDPNIRNGLEYMKTHLPSYSTHRGIEELAWFVERENRLLTPDDLYFRLGADKMTMELGLKSLQDLYQAQNFHMTKYESLPAKHLLDACRSANPEPGCSEHEIDDFLVRQTFKCRERLHDQTIMRNSLSMIGFRPIVKVEPVIGRSRSRLPERGFTYRYPVELLDVETNHMVVFKPNALPSSAGESTRSSYGNGLLARRHITCLAAHYALRGLRNNESDGQFWDLPSHEFGQQTNDSQSKILETRLQEYYSALPSHVWETKDGNQIPPSLLQVYKEYPSPLIIPNWTGSILYQNSIAVLTWCRPMTEAEFNHYERTGRD